mmetsp:Transcript_18556/g.42359  ORF Transcript_18556/g.42359 Transcript_18556/m.42359 type:complete len:205 (-) Transcript_18556:906-1520(-)
MSFRDDCRSRSRRQALPAAAAAAAAAVVEFVEETHLRLVLALTVLVLPGRSRLPPPIESHLWRFPTAHVWKLRIRRHLPRPPCRNRHQHIHSPRRILARSHRSPVPPPLYHSHRPRVARSSLCRCLGLSNSYLSCSHRPSPQVCSKRHDGRQQFQVTSPRPSFALLLSSRAARQTRSRRRPAPCGREGRVPSCCNVGRGTAGRW